MNEASNRFKEAVSIMDDNDLMVRMSYDPIEEERKINESIMEEKIERAEKLGLEQGVKQNQKEVVLNMFNEKFDVGIISKITGLSVNEIKEIVNK